MSRGERTILLGAAPHGGDQVRLPGRSPSTATPARTGAQKPENSHDSWRIGARESVPIPQGPSDSGAPPPLGFLDGSRSQVCRSALATGGA